MFEPDKKYLNISEVSERTNVPAHTLRYWETEFKQLKPERHSGIRKYSPLDVELIKKIKDLLYNKRYTIDGVKKCLTVDRRKKNMSNMQVGVSDPKILEEIKQELKEILDILE
ncbi:MerR family transcriptional regulator [Candidatus Ruminimicrobiellum ovillum]|jgi:DNA-binding transcriptional MerR regulator|uniref:MerR family transcriptional regulator n=1 Tax=Candidatus Ruminimicrobiellum ovillum TaxID=1947927 RepID=UPI00355954BB